MRRADLIVDSGKHVGFTLGFGKTGPFVERANWIKVDPYAQERDLAYRNLAAVFLFRSRADPRDVARLLVDREGVGAAHVEWRVDVAVHLAARNYPEIEGERINSNHL